MKGRVLYNWPRGWCEDNLLLSRLSAADEPPYDVAVIGAGVVGCALAWHLSQFRLRILLLDRLHDVGEGTSKANSAIIHTGFDAEPGTLESRLVTEASRAWPKIADAMHIPIRQTSALVLAMNEQERQLLPGLLEKAHKNGVTDVTLLDAEEVRALENEVSDKVRGALLVERESIIDPFAGCYAFAEVAVNNGVDLVLGIQVESVTAGIDGIKRLNCTGGRDFRARTVVNAGGLGSPDITRTYGGRLLNVNPRRGQFLIYDKTTGSKVSRILLPVPNPKTKGILVSPTIFGNVITGPTAEDLSPDLIGNAATTPEGMSLIREGASRLFPGIVNEPVISSYAGLRCNCRQGQYQVEFNDGLEGVVTLTGIRSTGLTVSVSLAEYIRKGLENECGLVCERSPDAIADRKNSCRHPGWCMPRPFSVPEMTAEKAGYVDLLCYCEQISRQEVMDALESSTCPRTIDALRRRTRAATGRCQGFYCLIELATTISDATGIRLEKITKKGPGSEIVKLKPAN